MTGSANTPANTKTAADTGPRDSGAMSLAGAFALYHKDADWDFYNFVADRIGLPGKPPDGMLAHFSGETGRHLEVIDLWTDLTTMEGYFTDFLAAAITDAIAIVERRADIEPKHQVTARVVLGPCARDFEGVTESTGATDRPGRDSAPVAVGYVVQDANTNEARYMAGCDLMGFPAQTPDGMILHVAGEVDHGWLFFDAWTDEALANAWYRRLAGNVLGDTTHAVTELLNTRKVDLKRVVLGPRLFDQPR
ncbi:MAG: hypothetical protein HY827_04630 [Actinobacteria bacterium]|nr:hypothetical protein [Actinomycetota bacterium]